jgi:hypothetical protein
MLDLAVEQVGDGGKADMRMRLDVQRLAGPKQCRPHAVEEDERPYQPPTHRRQGPSHREAANVAGTRNDQLLDGVAGEGVAGQGVLAGKERHGAGSFWLCSPGSGYSALFLRDSGRT